MKPVAAAREEAQRLVRLAAEAGERNDADAAISLLRRATAIDPDFAEAHYLLGTEHAQIGLFENAIDDMRKALTLDAELAPARFQLGLLVLSSRDLDGAEAVWERLAALGDGHCYVLFARGLIKVARDEFEAGASLLRKGLDANPTNAPLNADMSKVLEQVQAALEADAEHAEQGFGQHVLLGAYAGKPH